MYTIHEACVRGGLLSGGGCYSQGLLRSVVLGAVGAVARLGLRLEFQPCLWIVNTTMQFSSSVFVVALLTASASFAQDKAHFSGDAGWGGYRTPAIARSTDKETIALPYLYGDYGNFYARTDTFGYKLRAMGQGHLELATRLSFEGYQPLNAGLGNRARPTPIGVGTLQETSVGGFFLYGFHDPTSGGTLMESTYVAQIDAGKLSIYPQVGLEHRDPKYVNHLYGVSAIEATQSGLRAYTAGSSTSYTLGLAMEYPLPDRFKVTAQIRRRSLDKAIYDSPLVDARRQTSSFLAVSKVFD
jgi:outer membrane protein